MQFMNSKEQLKVDIVTKVSLKKIPIEDGMLILKVSKRTFERYLSKFKKKGFVSLIHGNKGKIPSNKVHRTIKSEVMRDMKSTYYDFNMTHALEHIRSGENKFSRETFRKWCHEQHLVKRKKKRRPKARYYRQRMDAMGLMLQMDGSHHRWFGNRMSCLICAIDDASSEIIHGEFCPTEDTINYLSALKSIVETYGRFKILYVDKAGVFGGTKRQDFAQVKRALEELGIQIIFANSPQAKGRVERSFNTLQDRLIPEMRIRNIHSYQAANSFLQEQFIPNYWNKELAVVPQSLESYFEKLPPEYDQAEIFCIKEYRSVAGDHTISWGGEKYLVESPVKYSISKQKIEIRTYLNLTWKAFYAGKIILLNKIEPMPKCPATRMGGRQ